MLSVCEAELEEVYGQEWDRHQTGRQLLIPNHLQTNDTEPCARGHHTAAPAKERDISKDGRPVTELKF